ncbi:MAG: sulfatase, partial [Nitrospirota bacterium]|nr:sulfatase [Nitrospirota bacterium]
DEAQERAFISNYQKLGFLKDDRLVILEPKKQVKLYEFSREDGREQEIPAEDDYISDAISYYQGAAYIYRHKLNRM